MMKRVINFILLVVFTLGVSAKPRSQSEAYAIARNFFEKKQISVSELHQQTTAESMFRKTKSLQMPDLEPFYVFGNENSFVIVSGDDRMKSILGYSDNSSFDEERIPDNMKYWLEMYAREAEWVSEHEGTETQHKQRFVPSVENDFPESVEPLLGNVAWNQSEPYNDMCPLFGSSRCVTGCVATAMAQIMYYHKYPETGKGEILYQYSVTGGDKSVVREDLSTYTFDWEHMLPVYEEGNYTPEEAQAVAKLMYACGVSVSMQYSPTGSGALSSAVAQAIIDNFSYDPNVSYLMRDFYSYDEMMYKIKKELSEGRPILYNGATETVGHAFVFDGYDADGLIHVNWGWSGMSNGYFELTSMDPYEQGIGGAGTGGGGFVYQQGMVYGIQKPTGETKYESNFFMEDSLRIDRMQAAVGETFRIESPTVYNMTTRFSGSLGIVMYRMNDDGSFSSDATVLDEYKTAENYQTYEGIFRHVFSASIDAEDGYYVIYVATKDERETSWVPVRVVQDYNNCIYAEIENGNINFYYPSLYFNLDGIATAAHPLYISKTGSFDVEIKNNDSKDFNGYIAVGLVSDNSAIAIAMEQVLLLPGQEKNLTIRGLIDPEYFSAGEYTVYLLYNIGSYFYFVNPEKGTNVTVNRKPLGDAELQLVVPVSIVDSDELYQSRPMTVNAFVENKGALFDDYIYARIYKDGEEEAIKEFGEYFFIEKGEKNISMSISHGLEPGMYRLGLFTQSNGIYSVIYPSQNAYVDFEVRMPSGIDESTADEGGLVAYPVPAIDVLNIELPCDVNGITVTNLEGQNVYIDECVHFSGETCVISVGEWPCGYYIVILRTDSGVMHKKFFKR